MQDVRSRQGEELPEAAASKPAKCIGACGRCCNAHYDLLAACENFLYGRKESRECEDEMRAAIAKAKGAQ